MCLIFEHPSCAMRRDRLLVVMLACSLVCPSTLAVRLGPCFVHLGPRELQFALVAVSILRPRPCLLREHASVAFPRSLARRLAERRLALYIYGVLLIVGNCGLALLAQLNAGRTMETGCTIKYSSSGRSLDHQRNDDRAAHRGR